MTSEQSLVDTKSLIHVNGCSCHLLCSVVGEGGNGESWEVCGMFTSLHILLDPISPMCPRPRIDK